MADNKIDKSLLNKKREKEISNNEHVDNKSKNKANFNEVSNKNISNNINSYDKITKKDKKKKKNDENSSLKSESINNSIIENDDIEIVENIEDNEKNKVLDACLPTISIAIPSSIIDNAQSKELRAYLVGQIARTCSIFKVDEIVLFHDSKNKGTYKDKLNFCLTNLQYIETPQYLRKLVFPINDDLALVGLTNPLDSDHHLRSNEYLRYREGVVLNRPTKDSKGSWANIGLKKDCFIEETLPEKTRVTVKLDKDCKQLHAQTELNENNECTKKYYTGKVVSSLEPKSKGLSWGYFVRVVDKFEDLFNQSIFNCEKYDLIIGTSDKGQLHNKIDLSKDSKVIKKIVKKKKINKIRHCLIVFGGIQGLESVVDDEETNKLSKDNFSELFDFYVNTCPEQGSRTIRTEEAIMITLSVLKDKLKNCNKDKEE